MAKHREIRANFDRESIVVYQAYAPEIADAVVAAGRFVDPFSWGRMTWIKPSFLWLMARSNWAQKSGQQRILAIRIRRDGWSSALALGVLTSFEPKIHHSVAAWREQFEAAQVHVQWDPERSLQGKKQQHRSIQVGLSRSVIRDFTDSWLIKIEDITSTAKKIRNLSLAGNRRRAQELLPPEKIYLPDKVVSNRLGMS